MWSRKERDSTGDAFSLMITLDQDTLLFAFPEIREQLRLLVDRHVQSILSSYVLPANRDELVDELGSMRPFWSLDRRMREDRGNGTAAGVVPALPDALSSGFV